MLLRIIQILLLATFVLGCKPPPNTSAANPAQPSAGSGTGSAVGPGRVIPVGRIAADVMQPGLSQRAADLAKRKMDAIRQNPKWWMEHMRSAKPGEPIAYDARMGLTPEEYNELQTQSKKTGYNKRADATITIAAKGNDVYVIDGGTSLSDLKGVEIDLKSGVVRTPYGITGKYKELTMPDTSPTGSWSGFHWRFETAGASDETGTTVALAIGRLKSSGRGILSYYVRKRSPPEEKKSISIMLNYDLPAR